MKDYDRRFIVTDDKKAVIAVNLKCGFATLNHGLVQSNPKPLHHYSKDPLGDVENAARVILFVREPQSRFKSFFRNWIVDKKLGDENNQVVYKNIKRYLSENAKKLLSETPSNERHTSEFLTFFLTEIGPAIMQERHMAPQWWLFQKYKIPFEKVTEFKSYRENIEFMKKEYGIEHSVRNITNKPERDPLDCATLDTFCSVVYARDYSLLSKYF